MGSDLKKRMKALVKLVEDTPGWEVQHTRGNNYKFVAPSGRCCFGPSTPSDYRSEPDVRRKLRQLGFPEEV